MNKQKSEVLKMLRPLENMKFFLHMLSYRPQAQIEQDLKSLGAVSSGTTKFAAKCCVGVI